ncbi:hypothetical protein ES703_102891 [subsurface metagenome]|jgi:hypothetical protein
MKKASFIMLLVVTSFYLSNFLHAQEKTQEKRSRIGFGVSLGKEIMEIGEAYTLLDFPSFYLPISLSSNFRIEPEIGYYRYSGSDEDWEESYSILSIGCGIFSVTQKGKVDIYYGLRLGLRSTSYSYRYTWDGVDSVDESKTDFYIGPAIGGEYFFTKHLTLGGEIQLNYIFIGQWDDGEGSESVIRTKPLIFVRWYL